MDKEDLHMLRLMGEIDRDGNHSQRELSSKLNLSLGLVNTFLKRLVNKGYFKMTTMPRNRVKYFLTPEGLARKSRLTAEYLRYSVNLYRDIKTLLLNKYQEMKQKEVKKILFFGAGEEAELAYLYLQLTDIQLVENIIQFRQDKKRAAGAEKRSTDSLVKRLVKRGVTEAKVGDQLVEISPKLLTEYDQTVLASLKKCVTEDQVWLTLKELASSKQLKALSELGGASAKAVIASALRKIETDTIVLKIKKPKEKRPRKFAKRRAH